MRATIYRPEKDFHFAFVSEDGQTVVCGKCHSELGKMSRLVLREESGDKRRIPTNSEYDPVRAKGRELILAKAGVITEKGAPYLTFKVGYIQQKDGLFALNSQTDLRSHERRKLQSRLEWMIKESERL